MKVFLVEDEFIVREGIKNNIDWQANGFEFCGEASDGELAFPMIKKERPDIVITDIRMPFMDGLELSRLIKKEFPNTRIMILSGYEEFEYAKTAIQIGVEEYLLKPINSEELLKAVRRVADKIREEQESIKNFRKYQKDSLENLENAKRELFNELISSEPALSEIIDWGRELELELTAGCYNILLLKIQRKQHGESFSERINQIAKEVNEFVTNHKQMLIYFDRAPEGSAYLFMGENEGAIDKNIATFLEFFRQTLEKYTEVSYFGSIGKAVMRLRDLMMSYEAASHAFAYRFLTEGDGVIRYEDIRDAGGTVNLSGDCLIGSVDAGNLDKRRIEGFLKGGEIEEIRYFVEEYIRNIGAEGNDSLLFRQYIVMDMYFAATNFLKQLDDAETLSINEPFQSLEQMQGIISHLDETMEYIVGLFSRVMELRDKQTLKRNSDVVEMARQYIKDNYSEEELTLNSVASHVNVSPNYLSAMFSQKTGQTFVRYLTDVRMSRAKELLKCTNKRSSEISEEVGYRDPHYFSYLFKKNQGCTPMQYRERGGSV
ncbi:MAG: response regulator [Roseburia sp.]|nr:response regulator [Roseburia sp.]